MLLTMPIADAPPQRHVYRAQDKRPGQPIADPWVPIRAVTSSGSLFPYCAGATKNPATKPSSSKIHCMGDK